MYKTSNRQYPARQDDLFQSARVNKNYTVSYIYYQSAIYVGVIIKCD